MAIRFLVCLMAFIVLSGCALPNADDRQVALVFCPTPVYPSELKNTGVFGSVVVEFTIGVDGSVTNAQVIRCTRPEFGAVVLAIIYQTKYSPGIKNGRAVSVRARLQFEFDPRDESALVPK